MVYVGKIKQSLRFLEVDAKILRNFPRAILLSVVFKLVSHMKTYCIVNCLCTKIGLRIFFVVPFSLTLRYWENNFHFFFLSYLTS